MSLCSYRKVTAFFLQKEREVINMAEIKKDVSENYLEEVKKAVKEIKYGSLTLIIQDGKVIQIDKTEKVRL